MDNLIALLQQRTTHLSVRDSHSHHVGLHRTRAYTFKIH